MEGRNLTQRQQAYLKKLGAADISQLTAGQKAYLTILGRKDGVEPSKPAKTYQPVTIEDLVALKVGSLLFDRVADLTWKHYGIVEVPIAYGGRPSGYKAIIRKGRLVQIAHQSYRLLPNEEVVQLADETAAALGAKPFTEFRSRWFNPMGNHVIYNRAETQVHALYAFDEPVKVEGVDTLHLGFAVHNSIDGSCGFGVGAFTFRHACSNMVLMGLRGYSLPFDERRTVAWIYQRHTPGLKVDKPNLQDAIVKVVDRGREVVEAYRRMAQERLNEQLARRIAESELPLRVLPDFIRVRTLEDGRRELEGFDRRQSLWDAYNSITETIWHNAKSDISTKLNQFNTLHAALPLSQ